MPAGTLLNVNVPAGEPEGVEVTSLGKRIYRDELKVAPHDDGTATRRRYWIYGADPGFHDEPGTDLAAVAEGRIAVTPIHFDLTDRRGLRRCASSICTRCWRPAATAHVSGGPERPPSPQPEPRAGAAGSPPRRSWRARGAAQAARVSRAPLLRARRSRDLRRRL